MADEFYIKNIHYLASYNVYFKSYLSEKSLYFYSDLGQ